MAWDGNLDPIHNPATGLVMDEAWAQQVNANFAHLAADPVEYMPAATTSTGSVFVFKPESYGRYIFWGNKIHYWGRLICDTNDPAWDEVPNGQIQILQPDVSVWNGHNAHFSGNMIWRRAGFGPITFGLQTSAGITRCYPQHPSGAAVGPQAAIRQTSGYSNMLPGNSPLLDDDEFIFTHTVYR